MNNFLFLLKQSLTIWILPAFILALILKTYNINLENFIDFTNGLIYFYLILFAITKTKFIVEYKNILLNLKYYLLTIICLAILYSNVSKIFWEYILLALVISIIFFILYSIYSIKKLNKISFNLNVFKNVIELMLCFSVIVFGIKTDLTKYIVLFGMFEIVYNVICLNIYINLKKRLKK
jgi:hypothetical protein